MEPQRDVYEPLNGLRGVAAICVAIYHAKAIFGVQFMPGGYLAVDLFFCLSGFVISHAYDRRLEQGMTAWRFFVLRLARFWPLYAVALLFAAAWMLAELVVRPPAMLTWRELAVATGLGLLFLPAPGTGDLYPLNRPSWSLLFELIVNVAYAALFPFLRTGMLCVIAGGAFLALILSLPSAVISYGVHFDDAHIGLLRAIFSFAVGAIIYRLRLPTTRIHPVLLLIIAVLPMAISHQLDLAVIALFFPFCIAAIATTKAPAWDRAFAWLGAISFALYAIHVPLFQLALATRDMLPPMVAGVLWVGMAVVMSDLLNRYMDRPLQRLFKKWSAGRQAPNVDGRQST